MENTKKHCYSVAILLLVGLSSSWAFHSLWGAANDQALRIELEKERQKLGIDKFIVELALKNEKLADTVKLYGKSLTEFGDKHAKHETALQELKNELTAANGKIEALSKTLGDEIASNKRTQNGVDAELKARPRIQVYTIPYGQISGKGPHERVFDVPADTKAISVWVSEAGASKTGIFGDARVFTHSVGFNQEAGQKKCRIIFSSTYNQLHYVAYVTRFY